MRPLVLLALLGVGLVACDSNDRPYTYVNVMSWDIHNGYDLATLAGAANEADLRTKTFDAYRGVLLANFPNRARRLADAIERSRPDVIALQDVASFRTESPGDFLTNPVPNATQVRLDYLQVLLDSLAGRGLSYRVAANLATSDFELPASSGAANLDIRFSQSNVILVSDGVVIGASGGGPFARASGFSTAGYDVSLRRGFSSISLSKDDVPIVVHSVQFPDGGDVDAAQRAEFVARISDARNVIVAGGVGPAEWPGGTFVDAWSSLRSGEEGATCCLSTAVDDALPVFSERSDKILTSGGQVLEVTRLGAELRDRLVSGLWPSDHAGVAARILFRSE